MCRTTCAAFDSNTHEKNVPRHESWIKTCFFFLTLQHLIGAASSLIHMTLLTSVKSNCRGSSLSLTYTHRHTHGLEAIAADKLICLSFIFIFHGRNPALGKAEKGSEFWRLENKEPHPLIDGPMYGGRSFKAACVRLDVWPCVENAQLFWSEFCACAHSWPGRESWAITWQISQLHLFDAPRPPLCWMRGEQCRRVDFFDVLRVRERLHRHGSKYRHMCKRRVVFFFFYKVKYHEKRQYLVG